MELDGVTVRIPRAVYDNVKVVADAERRSVTRQVEVLLEEALNARNT